MSFPKGMGMGDKDIVTTIFNPPLLLKKNIAVGGKHITNCVTLLIFYFSRSLKERSNVSFSSPGPTRSRSGQRSRSRLRRHQLATDLNFLGKYAYVALLFTFKRFTQSILLSLNVCLKLVLLGS